MSERVVPLSKFEARTQSEHRRSFKPGSGERHEVPVDIVKVYDMESLRGGNVPNEVASEYGKYPGKLHAVIRVQVTGDIYLRPFQEPADYIYLIYGNAVMLEGRSAKLRYENGRIETGQIILSPTWHRRQVEIPASSSIADIGGIL